MTNHHTPGPTIESPTKRLITIALQIVDRSLREGVCALCWNNEGGHDPKCLVGEALVHDPHVRRQAMAREEDDRE